MTKPTDVTIVILTYNGEEYIEQILTQISKQVIDKRCEILIIDSGSTDNTLPIISKFPSVKLHKIPNKEFGHGKTRNLAAQMANGEIVVYLTHDAVPSHDRWLYELTKPFEINPNIVGVMGKQIPRRKCFPSLKYEIQHVFSNFGPDFGTTIFYKDDFIDKRSIYDAVGFYSDANSAARKSFLTGEIPYKEVDYAEDQLFGRDIIEKGYYKAYAPRGSVDHSNDLKLSEYKHRMFDETLALRKLGILPYGMTRLDVLKRFTRGVAGDTIRIARDKSYGWKGTLYWSVVNPLFHIEKWRGVYKASNIELRDTKGIRENSLEAQERGRDT